MATPEFRVGSLFTGIGGLDLGLERAGMAIRWQCEIDDYCRQILQRHWPEVMLYGDIRELHSPEPVDLVCGGFPCQPFSVAGKQRGKQDDRFLWPEMCRVIETVRPTWVLGENVPGIINLALDDVLAQLEGIGYEAAAIVVPACAVDAPHRRDRVWIVAHRHHGLSSRPSATVFARRDTPGIGGQDVPNTYERFSRTGDEPARRQARPDADRCRKRPTLADVRCGRQPTDERGLRRRESNTARCIEDGPDTASDPRRAPGYGRPESPDRRGPNVVNPDDQRRQEQCGSEPIQQALTGPQCTGGRSAEPGLGRVVDGLSSWVDGRWPDEPDIPRVAQGIPNRVARLKALGNAVVPALAEALGRMILEVEHGR